MTVYTEVSDEDLTAFLDQYELGEVTAFKDIAEGVENSTSMGASPRTGTLASYGLGYMRGRRAA